MTVGREIILNEVNADFFGITRPQPSPSRQEVAAGLAFVNGTGQTVVMNVVEGQKLFGSLPALVSCPPALGLRLSGPHSPGHRPQFHGTKFVETDHHTLGWCLRVEFQKSVFFDSKSGSGDSFQVLVR